MVRTAIIGLWLGGVLFIGVTGPRTPDPIDVRSIAYDRCVRGCPMSTFLDAAKCTFGCRR